MQPYFTDYDPVILRKNSEKKGCCFQQPFLKILRLLTQQGQHRLWNLVCLRQHGSTSLLQDLRAGHVRYFSCVVSILDTRLSSRQVSDRVVQVVNGRFETVLNRTHVRTSGINFRDSVVSCSDESFSSAVIGDSTGQASVEAGSFSINQCASGDSDAISCTSTCANLDVQRSSLATVQQFFAVEVSSASDTVDFTQTLS